MNLVTLLSEEQLRHSHKALKWIDMLHMANSGHYGDSLRNRNLATNGSFFNMKIFIISLCKVALSPDRKQGKLC